MRSQQHLVFFNNFRLNFLRFYHTYFPLKQSLIAFHYRYLRCKVITFSKGVLSLISRKEVTFLNKLDTVCWFIRHSMEHSASVRLNFSQSERFRCWTIRFCFQKWAWELSKLYSRAFTTVYCKWNCVLENRVIEESRKRRFESPGAFRWAWCAR